MPFAWHSWNQIYPSSTFHILTSRVRTPQAQLRFKDLHLGRSMDKYKQQQQRELELKWRNPVDYGRRTMMQRENETTDNNHNYNCSSKNSNSTSSYLHNQQQSYRRRDRGSRGRSAGPGFDPQSDDSLYKNSIRNSDGVIVTRCQETSMMSLMSCHCYQVLTQIQIANFEDDIIPA